MPQNPLSPSNTQTTISRMMDNGELPASPDPATNVSSDQRQSRMPMNLALGAMGGGQLFDILSTRSAIQRGGAESNGIYGKNPSVGRITATKAATMIPLALLLNKLYASHPKIAAGMAAGVGGAGFLAGMHNQGVGRK